MNYKFSAITLQCLVLADKFPKQEVSINSTNMIHVPTTSIEKLPRKRPSWINGYRSLEHLVNAEYYELIINFNYNFYLYNLNL